VHVVTLQRGADVAVDKVGGHPQQLLLLWQVLQAQWHREVPIRDTPACTGGGGGGRPAGPPAARAPLILASKEDNSLRGGLRARHLLPFAGVDRSPHLQAVVRGEIGTKRTRGPSRQGAHHDERWLAHNRQAAKSKPNLDLRHRGRADWARSAKNVMQDVIRNGATPAGPGGYNESNAAANVRPNASGDEIRF
jgi:hypothetical protein